MTFGPAVTIVDGQAMGTILLLAVGVVLAIRAFRRRLAFDALDHRQRTAGWLPDDERARMRELRRC